jgi:hypothetical protein
MLMYEKFLKKKLPFLISNDIKKILYEIPHPISYGILKKIEIHNDITLVDLSDSDNMISFAYSNKIYNDIMGKNDLEFIDNKNFYFQKNKNKNVISIGKLIKKLFGNKFKPSGDPGNDIESFVNMFKNKLSNPPIFKIVKGKEIVKWYNELNYKNGDGTLNNSCMRYNKCETCLKFYEINSDKVSMLILKDDKNPDLIKGRSLLWDLDEPKNRIFMDRIYTVNNRDIYNFFSYAEKNNWIYRNFKNSSIKDSKNGKILQNIIVNNIQESKCYPYLDTLKYFIIDNNQLTNDYYSLKNKKYLILNDMC